MRISLFALLSCGLVSCGGAENPSSEQPAGIAAGVTLSPFYYLRCNGTDWGVDEGSRLLATADPNVFTRTITVASATNDPCSVTQTLASGPDQWGNAQTFFVTPASAPLPVPGNRSLVALSPQGVFQIQYPSAGSYVATFNAAQHTLAVAAAPPPGIPVSAPGEISAPGTYSVVADLSGPGPTLSIHDTHDVHLDCGGHVLTSTDAGQPALLVRNVQGFSVSHCKTVNAAGSGFFALTITGAAQGLLQANDLGGTSVQSTASLTLDGNTVHPFYTQISTTGSTIQNNAFTADGTVTSAALVVSSGGSFNKIQNNTMDGRWPGVIGVLTGADDGIVLQNEANDFIFGNTIHDAWDCGFESVGTLTSTTIANNTFTTDPACCVGAFLSGNWRGNDVSGNVCTNVGQLFAFTHGFGHLPGEGTVFFQDNSFRNNTQRAGSFTQISVFDFVHIPADVTPLSLGNNLFLGNTLLGPTPTLLPASMIVDGGGNSCTKGTDPAFPLACGRP